MTGFEQSGWGDAAYDRGYREAADVFIPQRATLLHIAASFYRTLVAGTGPVRVLDLGCGDGILAQTICAQGGELDVSVTDGSAEMLAAARTRLAGLPVSEFSKITFEAIIAGDFRPAPFDLIVSSFAIHHLATAQKAALFETLFGLLKPGGYFLNTDVVLSDDPVYTEWHFTLWREWIAARQEGLGLDEDYTGVPAEARAKDENQFDALSVQLAALRHSGFAQVECHYRYGLFAIYGGRRPGA